MCKVGDIIVIISYKGEDNRILNQHSFVVLNDENDIIEGFEYDLVTTVMSSFKGKTEAYRNKKLSFRENLGFKPENQDLIIDSNNEKGYMKADKLYFFEKNKMNFSVIGSLDSDVFKKLIDLITQLDNLGLLVNVTTNLEGK